MLTRKALEDLARAYHAAGTPWRMFWQQFAEDAIGITLRDGEPLARRLCCLVVCGESVSIANEMFSLAIFSLPRPPAFPPAVPFAVSVCRTK